MVGISSQQIRQKFLEYFQGKNHTLVSSSSLVPGQDPSLLFTNAGMVQFKDVFLGIEKRSYTRAASVQRCVRAGGKHNDLENVGYTARHHTFFEMMGNFSFGDYFKRDAIRFAWEFLTQELKLPPERLWVTVYEKDDEAAQIWLKEIGVDASRFSRCGDKDNFWAMGDTGPCGPCSEIFFDHGPEIPGGPPGSPDADADRYIEIWNLVFMQFERSADGHLKALPKPSVDTGMGLERLAAVMQGVHNNYDTDLFQPLILAMAELARVRDLKHTSLRVIADHIRSISFLISDGVIPSNEGRGYVLRRIIRRAARHGSQLGMQEPFLYRLVNPLIKLMGSAYPELSKTKAQIEEVLLREEQQFARTLEQGLRIFEQDIAQIKNKILPGTSVFRLYDTYGFPVDLTADLARERGLSLDMDGFEKEMARQRQQSQAASQFHTLQATMELHHLQKTEFKGYETLRVETSTVLAIYRDGEAVEILKAGETGSVILEHTPFYAESGGQVGDKGILQNQIALFSVHDTRKQATHHVLHIGQLEKGEIRPGDRLEARVDEKLRLATQLNHSATHLLHAALKQVLGEHVQQKGSLVAPDRLRFDFTHSKAMTAAEIKAVERLVNAKVRADLPVQTEIMSPEKAKQQGAVALFGEKYGEEVRVLSMGDFSKELCGGTHVERTGVIGLFRIISEAGIATGVRRIEALTGEAALDYIDQDTEKLQTVMNILKASRVDVLDKLQQQLNDAKDLEKKAAELQMNLVRFEAEKKIQLDEIKASNIVVLALDNTDTKALREIALELKEKYQPAVVIVTNTRDQQIDLLVAVSSELTPAVKAGELLAIMAKQLDGKGGGKAELAQGSGTNPENLKTVLSNIRTHVIGFLSGYIQGGGG